MVKNTRNGGKDEGGDETQRRRTADHRSATEPVAEIGGPSGPSGPDTPLKSDPPPHPTSAGAASTPTGTVELFQQPFTILDALHDGAGQYFVRYGTHTHSAVFKLNDLGANPKGVVADLGRAGVLILDNAAMRALQSAVGQPRGFRPALIATQPGWCGERHYVCGDGEVLRPSGDATQVVVAFQPVEKFAARGTHADYITALGPLVRQQHLLVFGLDLSLASALLTILGPAYENGGSEIVGGPGDGKTTMLMLAASAHSGRLRCPIGGAENWSTTANALEPTMVAHSDGCLALDEEGLAGDGKVAAELVSAAAFRLGQGTTRDRLGSKRASVGTRLFFLSTSNKPLRTLLKAADDRAPAIRQRLRTIDVSKAPHGCFDHLPQGVDSYADLSKSIKSAVNRYWGSVGRVFLQGLVEDRARDEAALIARIEGRIKRFKSHLAAEGVSLDERTADFVAVIYAAGRLARDYGAIPKAWGKPRDAVMAAVRLLDLPPEAPPASAEFVQAQLERYARQNDRRIRNAEALDVPLSAKAFQKAAGFWFKEGGVEMLVIPATRFRAKFPEAESYARIMRKAGLAQCEGGKRPKLTKKAPRPLCRERGERAYFFVVPRPNRTCGTKHTRA